MSDSSAYFKKNASGEYILDFSPLIAGEKNTLPFELNIAFGDSKKDVERNVEKNVENNAELSESKTDFSLFDFSLFDEVFEKDVVSCNGTIVGSVDDKNEEFTVSFKTDVKLKVLCSRCAEEMDYFVKKEFSTPICDKKPDRNSEDPEKIEEYETFKKGKLNISEMVREFIILSLPSQFLCKKTCAGLCPSCGTNLNNEKCGCDNGEIDSRLKPLADLLKKLTEEDSTK